MKCNHCGFLEKTFPNASDMTNREYWLYTEMFSYLHDGVDKCNFINLKLEKMSKSITVKGKENDVIFRLFENNNSIDEIHIKIEGENSWAVIGYKDLQMAIEKAEKKFTPKELNFIDYLGFRYWYEYKLAKDKVDICLATKDPKKYCNGFYLFSTKDPGNGKAFVIVKTDNPDPKWMVN